MSILERRIKENESLRQKVLEAAVQVLAADGYERLSMRKIASLIDYSPTTIYRFFRNKEDLLANLALQAFADLSAEFEKIKAAGHEDALILLKSLISSYVAFCLERPDMFRLFDEMASFELEEGVMYERLGTVRRPVYQSWREAIKGAIASGLIVVNDEARIFLYLWDSVHGYIDHRVNSPGVRRKTLENDPGEFLDLLFHGIEAGETSR
jgi:AcrR family transcriptional regulator